MNKRVSHTQDRFGGRGNSRDVLCVALNVAFKFWEEEADQ